jgi:hypothetical protein
VPISTQGVRPIDAASRAALEREGVVTGYVLQLTSSPDPDAQETADMLAFYRAWRAIHGVILAELIQYHPDFWTWAGN